MSKIDESKKVKISDKKRRPNSYNIHQSMNSRETGLYKFPGQFVLLGILLLFFWTMIRHPLGVVVLGLGILSFGLEAIFLSRRSIKKI